MPGCTQPDLLAERLRDAVTTLTTMDEPTGREQLSPREALLWDEALRWEHSALGDETARGDASDVSANQSSARLLVIDSAALAHRAQQQGLAVRAFCDDAVAHRRLGGQIVVEPGEVVEADTVWIDLPKSLDALDEYCDWAVACGAQTALVSARIKDLTRSASTVLERHFAEVSASLGRQKSRVLRAHRPIAHPAGWRPGWPRNRTIELPSSGTIAVTHHGATFASGRLDPATGLLLEALSGADLGQVERAVDWGSGAGLIATWLARRLPSATVEAVDQSWAAVASTRATTTGAGVSVPTHWDDGVAWLDDQPDGSLDLVVSNPPFHQGVAKDSGPTRQMLGEAVRVLRPGGQLWVVHNSHLPWAQLLRDSRAGRVGRAAQDRQFTVTTFAKH